MNPPSPQPAGNAPLVLVVDDQPESARHVAEVLELVGYRTLLAFDGEAAVSLCLEHQPAAVILDLHMPVMGGLVACTHIRRQPDGSKMRLIALTGSTSAESRVAAELAGFDHFLAKPLMTATLLRVLPPLPGA
ncbi:response regulator [Ramlibacter ginsenosidimutans]|uniref:Response regulator n=1 Tax=Ramlibacter ginsenosidimutans TaxID=502333 RepID=A0A934TSU6_9BURK|nr:response regulator [Ramlibacter ginsenosidimutans]MBK6006758.1 response regulator [Ramlibacter ginsenosidimutans]